MLLAIQVERGLAKRASWASDALPVLLHLAVYHCKFRPAVLLYELRTRRAQEGHLALKTLA